jgi:hypothetical protein
MPSILNGLRGGDRMRNRITPLPGLAEHTGGPTANDTGKAGS